MVYQRVLDIVFSPYGWLITAGLGAALYVYFNNVQPYLEKRQEAAAYEAQKKFDAHVNQRDEDKLKAIRARQQAEYDQQVAERAALKKKQKEEAEQAAKAKAAESTGKAATTSKDVPKKKASRFGDMTAKQIVNELINSKAVFVFSKSWCPFCRKAKETLATYRLEDFFYEVLELDLNEGLPVQDIVDELYAMTGAPTVPRVFIGGKFVGGGDDTARLFREGKLDTLINEATAELAAKHGREKI
ncbi:unnamed protein product, partial [Mesorhabditis spiculigera]